MTRLSAFCRRMAAVHEAGHAIAAANFGVMPDVIRIWSVENPEPMQISYNGELYTSRLWRGEVRFTNLEEQSADARRVIGIAGAAAEITWLKLSPDAFFAVSKGLVSESDWRIIGRVAGGPSNVELLSLALKKAMKIVQSERKLLLELSRRLIIASRVL